MILARHDTPFCLFFKYTVRLCMILLQCKTVFKKNNVYFHLIVGKGVVKTKLQSIFTLIFKFLCNICIQRKILYSCASYRAVWFQLLNILVIWIFPLDCSLDFIVLDVYFVLWLNINSFILMSVQSKLLTFILVVNSTYPIFCYAYDWNLVDVPKHDHSSFYFYNNLF